jgi:hypothetical protein
VDDRRRGRFGGDAQGVGMPASELESDEKEDEEELRAAAAAAAGRLRRGRQRIFRIVDCVIPYRRCEKDRDDRNNIYIDHCLCIFIHVPI